jgi:hypothetical protein
LCCSQADIYFREYGIGLVKETVHAQVYLNCWEYLDKYLSSYSDVLKQAPLFFTFTMMAYHDMAILGLAKILDKDRRGESLNIWKFMNFVEQNIKKFNRDDIEKDRKKLFKLQQTINNITAQRDKDIGHIDRAFLLSGNNIAREFPLKPQELRKVIETIFQVLRRYMPTLNPTVYSADYKYDEDLRRVLDSIRLNIEKNRIR